jgi:hypothetical protein
MWRAASSCVTGTLPTVRRAKPNTHSQTWDELRDDKDTLRQVVAMASAAMWTLPMYSYPAEICDQVHLIAQKQNRGRVRVPTTDSLP